jgi:hypothetical protein
MGDNFSTLIANSDRSFSNLYDVKITFPNNANATLQSLDISNIGYLAEDINFGDGFTLDVFYSEPTKENFIVGASRAKTVSITFREKRDFSVSTTFRQWQSGIYSQQLNAFLSGNPTGVILIQLDPDNYTGGGNNNNIIIRGAIPTKVGVPALSWKDGNPLIVKIDFSITDIDFQTSSYLAQIVSGA